MRRIGGSGSATTVVSDRAGVRGVRAGSCELSSRRALSTIRGGRSTRAPGDARRASGYFDQRQDLEQIVRIAERWEQATANRDRHAQSKVDRRLDAWLEREIRESIREPHNHRYTRRVRALSDELAMLERAVARGHALRAIGHTTGTGIRARSSWLRRQEGSDPQRARPAVRTAVRAREQAPLSVRLSFAYR